ncbi:hypothetical protein CP532_0294 [Ophiocordyceps camponoti-leonardi (nom. inval.)]|nr:hypothetical protein CP532_0294 [Ophiocordyceps camponoti-leonardi (nom. inval.)]
MLHHWATAAAVFQTAVHLLVWPSLVSAGPLSPPDDDYYPDDILPSGLTPPDPMVTEFFKENLMPLPAKKTTGHGSTSASTSSSSPIESPTPSTSGTQHRAGEQNSRWSIGFLRSRFGDRSQEDQGRGNRGLSAVDRVMVFIGGACVSSKVADEPESSDYEDEDEEVLEYAPPRATQLEANLTLYFGPLRLYPSFTRRLPAPQPTSYSKMGVPEFEFWYAWQPGRDWKSRPQRPFQLIPKAGGVYRPPRGAIGSLVHVCPETGVKDPRRGWPPALPGFPGAPASGWFFEMPSPGTEVVLYGKANVLGGTFEERPQWHMERVQRLLNFIDIAQGPEIERVRVLVFEIFLFVLPRIPGGIAWREFRHVHVMAQMIFTYAPHFGEILLRFYYLLLYRTKRDLPASNGPRFYDQLVESLSSTLDVYTVPENGLYVDCNSTALSTYLDATNWTPSLSIKCHPPTDGKSCKPRLGYNESAESVEITVAAFEAKEVPHAYDEDDEDEDEDAESIDMDRSTSVEDLIDSDLECSQFSELEFGIQLDGGDRSSTRDSIYVSFNNQEEMLIRESPWSGYHNWMTIDKLKLFQRDRFTVRDILHVSLISKMNDDKWDGWGLKGIKLRAKCADSTTKWGVDKFANINKWMDRGNGRKISTVWHGNISPKDWREITILDSCDRFDRLQISVDQRPVDKGSQDRVFISFGMEGKQNLERKIRDDGKQYWQPIDIQRMWDTPAVGLDQIDHIQIKQLHVGDVKNSGWAVLGFKLKGSCAGYNTLMEYGLSFENITQQSDKLTEYSHQGIPSHTIWRSDEIDVNKDWTLLYDCVRWDKLVVEVGFSGIIGLATYDSIYVSFARDKTLAPEQLVVEEPSGDTWYRVSIDLGLVFGTDVISIEDVSYFRLFAKKYKEGRTDRWRVTSIIFAARCAHDHSQWVENTQYMGIEKTVDAYWTPPDKEVEGPLSWTSWHRKTASVRKQEQKKRIIHDADEF